MLLEFVPEAGVDRAVDPRTPEGADFIAEAIEFLPPISQVVTALGDVHPSLTGGFTTPDDSHTAEAIGFAGQIEIDGWIIRERTSS